MQNIWRIQNRDGTVSWQIDFAANGKRHRRSYKALKEAKNALAHFYTQIANNAFVDPNRFDDIWLDDLISKYKNSTYNNQRVFESKLFFIKRIRDYFDG